jgi:dipeptidyl aminopeptidase/acylaminoacyl peptidase
MTLPTWARDAPDRLLYASNDGGKWELYAWDRAADEHRQVTDRSEGTLGGAIDPTGRWIWWFDDDRGNEFGRWMVEPFEGGDRRHADGELPPAYSAGLSLGREVAVIGSSADEGSSVHLVRDGEAQLLYRHREDAGVAGLSRDEDLLCISHSEHGDTRHPALRVLDLEGRSLAELWDGPGLGLASAGWSRVPGDRRLLVVHERTGQPRPAVWRPETGEVLDLELDLPGEVTASWYPDGSALLLGHDHRARVELYRFDLSTGALEPLDAPPGTVSDARVRPDGGVWFSWSDAAHPSEIRSTAGGMVVRPAGEPAPDGVPYEDVDADGVHVMVAKPLGPAPYPVLFQVHGGPTWHDRDAFVPSVQAWVDHGFAVALVNYRGSTGYGKEWRDALEGNPGLTELEDLAKAFDAVTAFDWADRSRVILSGGSWGGYLTLLGLGTQPDRWALGIAAVPVADYAAAFEDEMEPLKAFDRSLFGGTPEEVPEVYVERSPITYVERVRVPVMILAGENDPRCPIRQIENYLARLDELGKPHDVYRYDAGHGSLVIEESIRQIEAQLAFASRKLGTSPPT